MKIVYAPQALRDIDEILAYLFERSPRGAHSVSLAIEHEIQRCGLNPHLALETDEPNLYRRPLVEYRYTIFYRVNAETQHVEIARVLHGARVKNLRQLPED